MSRCVKSSIKNWVDCRYPRARQKAPISKFWGFMLNLPQLKRGFLSPHLLAAFSLYLISEQLAQFAVRSSQSAVHDSADRLGRETARRPISTGRVLEDFRERGSRAGSQLLWLFAAKL